MPLKYVNGGVMKANAKNRLDAYYTKPAIAKELLNTTQEFIAQYENLANGKEKDISCVFQIWSKNHKNLKSEFSWYRHKKGEPFSHLLKVVTVSLAKNRECGKAWIFEKKANFYLSSTFFKQTAVVPKFWQVNHQSEIAITYHENAPKDKLDTLFLNANWCQYSSLATNGCRHIGKAHIFKLLQNGGFKSWILC
ncbi:hypothetical protein NHP21005_17260 [Helicobacter sp. NHP21005]|uniref:hypothetical protein n=1 Tax=Helicobacter felistomachi TaxID=3040201 RepID=UPI00257443D4|nr:hypothetical protein [Helicobacter sp. NHP21005]BEG58038.1 hypothetical protein NHP21005_17260 [Helicobacter sp. NHP21005]